MFTTELLNKFSSLNTPFYYYDNDILEHVLNLASSEAKKHKFHVHYAFKANVQPTILRSMLKHGFGADCVGGNEITCAIENGFKPKDIVFAGVGKSDWEIELGLSLDIFAFNVESLEEILVINHLAKKNNKIASIAARINPNVNAKTHKYITTGLDENKFGISTNDLDELVKTIAKCDNIKLLGLHFHIGSQVTDLTVFKNLCNRVNQIQRFFTDRNINLPIVNVGGGLGVSYENPDDLSEPNFEEFFTIFDRFLDKIPGQEVHFELGRALVAQCSSLICKTLYVKKGVDVNFAIVDAGMTELLRPALYGAYHKIENISKAALDPTVINKYDVVGPICETSDSFGKAVRLPMTERGDLIAIRSTGAYGEVMSNRYNLRDLPKSYWKNDL
ncbi:MAG: diaminopimelate decarboxylase [Sphingobacteriales bacterium]|jgi:diaminopimelate decarboxylase